MPELLDLLLVDNEQDQVSPESEITIDALPAPDKKTADLIAWLRMVIKRFLARPRVGYLPAELLTFGEDTPIHELQALRQRILTKLHGQPYVTARESSCRNDFTGADGRRSIPLVMPPKPNLGNTFHIRRKIAMLDQSFTVQALADKHEPELLTLLVELETREAAQKVTSDDG